MIDFKSFCLTTKAVWRQRLYYSSNKIWAIIPQKHMEQCGIHLLMCLNIDKEKQIPFKLSKFYREVIFS